jgi:hypothetical protein
MVARSVLLIIELVLMGFHSILVCGWGRAVCIGRVE